MWLVGYKGAASYQQKTFTAHWDGTKWSVVKSPNKLIRRSIGDQLYGVSASSSADVWAVGFYGTSTGVLPLALHWDGSLWSVVKTH